MLFVDCYSNSLPSVLLFSLYTNLEDALTCSCGIFTSRGNTHGQQVTKIKRWSQQYNVLDIFSWVFILFLFFSFLLQQQAPESSLATSKYKLLNREERRCRAPREAASIKGGHWTDEAGMDNLFC